MRKAGNKRLLFEAALGSAREVRMALRIARRWLYISSEHRERIDALLDQECAILWTLLKRNFTSR